MNPVVVTAADREPYVGHMRALHAEVAKVGLNSFTVEAESWPEGPHQGKRRSLAAALRTYPGAAVYWVDADMRVRHPEHLRALFPELPSEGLHVSGAMDLLGATGYVECQPARTRGLIRWCARGMDVQHASHVNDWLFGLKLSIDQTSLFFMAWNFIVKECERAGHSFTTGISLGLCAAAAGVPVVVRKDQCAWEARTLKHLHAGHRSGVDIFDLRDNQAVSR